MQLKEYWNLHLKMKVVKKPNFVVRTLDEKTNETIKDINYKIIANLKMKP